jgi:hypothetical protein
MEISVGIRLDPHPWDRLQPKVVPIPGRLVNNPLQAVSSAKKETI